MSRCQDDARLETNERSGENTVVSVNKTLKICQAKNYWWLKI